MAPQVFGKARFVPGIGALRGPSIRKCAACCLRSPVVDRPMRVGRNSQAAHACITHGLRPEAPQAMGSMLAGCRAQMDSILGVAFLLGTACNPLKSPESDEGIQENPSPFSWFGLVW